MTDTHAAPRTVLVVENSPSDPMGRLAGWLTAAGLELDVRATADAPQDLAGYAGLMVLGFPDSANEARFAPVRALLRQAVTHQLPTLAICGGAQLLALAHGGRVQPNPDGPELGAHLIARRTSSAADPLFAALPITPDVVQWHWDAVTQLPPGAHLLASSPTCANQAFRVGRLAWGIQFHVEVTPADVRRWAAGDAHRLDGYDLERILARVEDLDADLVEVWQPFALAYAAVVRSPNDVPEARGGPTTSAEPVTDPAAIRAALAAQVQAAHAARAALPMPVWLPPGRG